MYTDLKGKVALITGATKGIGRGIAEKYADLGVKLVLNYSTDETAAEATRAVMDGKGADYLMIKADMSNPASIKKMYEEALLYFGKINIVVANAGIELVDTPFVEHTEEDYYRVFDLNVKGTFFVMQQAALHIAEGGRILVISSTQSLNSETGAAIYAASKAAAKKFVEILSKETGHRNVTVNSIMPGVIDNAGVIAAIGDEFKNLVKANSPLGRLGTAKDIAKIAGFLASDEGGYINGAHIKANGGSSF